MRSRPSGVYAGVPAEQRRAERRVRLMAAALDVMGTEGWSATTVRGVCRRAKLTPRFFYESFEDLDALAVAVFDKVVGDATAKVLAAVAEAGDDPHDQARAAIATFISELTDDPRRARVAFVEALGSEPMARRRLETLRTLAGLIATQARVAYGPPPEADGLVDATATLLAGRHRRAADLLARRGPGRSRDELVDDCVALFIATGEAAAAVGRVLAAEAVARVPGRRRPPRQQRPGRRAPARNAGRSPGGAANGLSAVVVCGAHVVRGRLGREQRVDLAEVPAHLGCEGIEDALPVADALRRLGQVQLHLAHGLHGTKGALDRPAQRAGVEARRLATRHEHSGASEL